MPGPWLSAGVAVVVAVHAPALALPAFPGADGFGRNAQGGRGGRIIEVTRLVDAGPGSLRACIDAIGPRVCVFRVGGVIRFTTVRPIIRNPFLTIAGQTAPGGGILLTHAGGKDALTPLVIKNTHDVIVRHIRVRTDRRGELRASNSGFIIEGSRNVLLDHVSSSWAIDENVGGYAQNTDVTISNSIFAEGIPRHDKCALLSSDPKGPQRLSFLRNLCAHNGDRNPDVNFPPGSCVEVVNNVFYNAQSQFTEVWESYGGTPVNLIGNYYKAGPNSSGSIAAVDRPQIGSTGPARIYQAGNLLDGRVASFTPSVSGALVTTPVCGLATRPLPAQQAYKLVLAQSGAFPRDAVDARIVGEVRTRTGNIRSTPGVLPPLSLGIAYVDRDHDGMSDAWERSHRADSTRNDAWEDADRDGWPNLDEFLDFAHRSVLSGRPVR